MKTETKAEQRCEKSNIQSTDKTCEWSNTTQRIKWPMNALECCDYACFLWLDLLIAWNWVKFLYYMQCNTTIVYYKLPLLPSSSFRISSCRQSSSCCQFAIRISSTINFSAVKFKREFHFTNISNPHTVTALFASLCTCIVGQAK